MPNWTRWRGSQKKRNASRSVLLRRNLTLWEPVLQLLCCEPLLGDDMSAIGDLVVNLVARTQQFTSPIVQSMRTMSEFSGSVVQDLDAIAERSGSISTVSGVAGGGLYLVAQGAQAIGASVPGLQSVYTVLLAVSAAAELTSAGASAASGALRGVSGSGSVIQRISDLLYRISSAAALASVGLRVMSFVMSRFGADTSRVDALAGSLGRAAMAAGGVRLAILGASLAARAFSAIATAPLRAAQAAWGGVTRAVNGTRAALATVVGAAQRAAMSLSMVSGGGLGGLTLMIGGAGLAGAMGLLAGQSVALASSLETNQVAFTTMMGSAEAANQHLTDLQQFAAKTPFEFPELVDASRRLQALGFDAQQSIPVMRIVGDAVGSLGLGAQGIDRITLALGQMQSKGKVSAQEINQLAEAGIPAWAMIADRIGVSIPQAMKLAENGAISAGTGINAVLEGMQSRFGGGMERQADTLSGRFSTLKDSIGLVLTDIGQELISAFGFKEAISSTTSFIDRFRSEWMPSVSLAINSVAEVVRGFAILAGEAWNGWLGNSIGLLADFVMNFDLYWQIAYQNIVLWVTNAIASFAGFFINAGELLVWFSQNWFSVLTDIGNIAVTIFTNLGENLKGIWSGVMAFVRGEGFQFNPTDLMDGFESSISQLPQFTAAAVAETTPELERLYEELAQRYTSSAAAAANAAVPAVAAATEAAFKPLNEELMTTEKAGEKEKSSSKVQGAAALTRNSAGAIAALQRGQQGGTKSLEQLSKQQLAELKKVSAGIASALTGLPVIEEVVVDFG